MKITIQVFQNGQPIAEHIGNVKHANTELEAVDYFLKYARIDLTYRFLGSRGFITPSFPNEYRVQR